MTDLLIGPVLEHYGFHLDRADGGWQTIRCVFHGETQASARVSFTDGAYKCMACPARGNAITLIAWKEGCDNSTAFGIYQEILGRSGIAVPSSDGWQSGGGVPAEPRSF